MKHPCILTVIMVFSTILSLAQNKRLPVIDMHLHALYADGQGPPPLQMGAPFKHFGAHDALDDYRKTFMRVLKNNTWADVIISSPSTDDSMQLLTLSELEKFNVYAVTSGEPEILQKWKKVAPQRIIKSADWSFGLAAKGLTTDSLRKMFASHGYRVFGEVSIQYEGVGASDSAFEPYLAMAEELDVPVGIHVGNGPPGAALVSSQGYRAGLHSALVLEEALNRHPKLRVYAMHAGWPMLDDMIAMLYTYPQLYVDIGAICYMIPTKEFYFYLERLCNAGFSKRIMFGSDNMVWPDAIGIGIRNIEQAKFLTDEQKRDILFNNAARFLRLTETQIRDMNR